MISFYTLSVLLFFAALIFVVYLDRKNFIRQGIVFLRKTNKGKIFIDKLAARFPRFWRFYGNAGIAIFIPAMLLIVYLFGTTIFTVLTVPQTKGVGLLVPSFTPEAKAFSGGLAVPFWYWLLGIVIIAVVHEFAHGIIARREGIKVKSLGGVLFGPILGAFVEIDEKQMAKKDWKIQARIASAGALTNMVFAILFLIIFLISLPLLFVSHGMGFGVDPNGPLNTTGLGNDTGILKSVNGIPIHNYNDLSSFLITTHPGDKVDVHYQDTNFTDKSVVITLTNRTDGQPQGYMGILTGRSSLFGLVDGSQYKTARAFPSVTEFFLQFLGWLATLNLLVGLFNLLPAKPLDGGLIWEAYARRFAGKYRKSVVKITNYIIYGMFAILAAGILRGAFF